MSYTFNTSGANVSSGNTIALSPATGALIVVFSGTSSGGGTPTVTFSDNSSSTWANASNNVNVGGTHYSVGYCLSALAGVTTITATYNGGTPGTCNLVAVSYTGLTSPSFVAVTTPNSQVAPGTGTDAVVANALACGSTSALLVGASFNAGDHTAVAGTGFTQRYGNDPNFLFMLVEDPAAEKTGSQTMTWTAASNGGGDTYGNIAIAFADNAGASIPVPAAGPMPRRKFILP
jgi:hypothetical protein